MSKVNQIQKAITELNGGQYQKLLDKYIYKRFGFTNIMPYGSQTGTNKTTKGIPDSYVRTNDGKYILIMYGTVEASSYKKIEKDILDCLNPQKTKIEIEEIEKIICCYTSTNISIDEHKILHSHFESTILIGLGELSLDLYLNYPNIAMDELSVAIDTHQILDDEDFVKENDKNQFSTSLDMNLLCREEEKSEIFKLLEDFQVILISGKSGFGKTRLALEVAREYCDKNNMELKIIKANGESIYDDLKAYFLNEKNFVIIVDDANKLTQLNHLLEICIEPKRKSKFKIILTVRDYAREDTVKRIKEFLLPSIYTLKQLDNDSIEKVLKNNLNIVNPIYIEQIQKIAKGNIRLAIMAGTCSKIGSFENILNSFDIFDTYFDSIVSNMDRKEILTATLIAFFDTIKLDIDENVFKIASDLGISNSDFLENTYKLHKKEVVNIYNDLAVKFDNQNLGDYLLYYVFFKNKWISPSKFILNTFSEYRGRVIYSFNTLIQLFYSKENLNFIEMEIKKAWHKIRDIRTQSVFIESFYRLMKDEALLYIKKEIDNLPEIHVDFTKYDFDRTKNNHKIDSKLLEMLAGFKYTDTGAFADAIQLIFLYLEKNTENPMDFYFIFSEKIGIDKKSFNMDYQLENILLSQIIDYYEEKKTMEAAYCLMFYISNCLNVIYKATEGSYPNQYLIYTFKIVFCDSSVRLRTKSIEMLSKLYLMPELRKKVIKLLIEYPSNYQDKDNVEVIRSDIIAFDKYFSGIFDYNNFNECILMNHFNQICRNNLIGNFYNFLDYKKNKVFTFYINIKKDKYKRRNYTDEEIEKKRLKKITKLGLKMNIDDFAKLFNELQNDTVDSEYDYKIGTGIELLINSISRQSTKLMEVVREYLRNDTPFYIYSERIIQKMIDLIGYIETENIIRMYEYKKKNMWISTLYNLIPKDKISKQTCNDMVEHLFEQKESDLVYTIKLYNAFRINNIQKDFLIRYIESVNKIFNKRPWVSAQLLDSHIGVKNEDAYKLLINIFLKNIDILQEAYLLALDGKEYFDLKGKLFLELVNQDIKFIDKVVCKINDINFGQNRNILGTLWRASNYEELIRFTVESIGENCEYAFLVRSIFTSLFANINRNKELSSKQEKWIMNYIDINYNNDDVIKNLFEIICNFSEETRRNILLHFCKMNSSFKVFKELYFFPNQDVFGESQVPGIEKKINFIRDIKNELVGIKYIEHRAYLDERILKLEEYKEKTLINEFLGDRYM
ncbi:hypothetical protein [Clostridium saccharoperbutylacetonicum]|uniref:nSTAND3 domain-containing NTPase n=1 Tax=Clostridium saccharoperbutylacetonicum TaxID=36745 RepID=UPI0039E80841